MIQLATGYDSIEKQHHGIAERWVYRKLNYNQIMDRTTRLHADSTLLEALLRLTTTEAGAFLQSLAHRPVNNNWRADAMDHLPAQGIGAQATLARFTQQYAAAMTGSAGPRYLGFVTGGSTPAALMGDWLTSVYDQNACDTSSAVATAIEASAIAMLRELFGLPTEFAGLFVSGATMSNCVGLAIARQWWGRQRGANVAVDGLAGLPRPVVLSGAPHACIYKSLAMLGVGRAAMHLVPTLPDREAVDVAALRTALAMQAGQPCIVVANAGVVNTVDFDDIAAIAELRQEFNFYLHVDAAFGGFAACSPRFRHLVAGWEAADSIAVDAHKWLNVPYESAVQLTRHTDLQMEVFQNTGAAYLGAPNREDAFHLTPENSRRLRALPAWFTLMAYGADGYRAIVEQSCTCAARLAEHIAASTQFRLLAPARMNVVVFALQNGAPTGAQVRDFLQRLHAPGQVFLTPTTYAGLPALRAAFSNWRTTVDDVEVVWAAMLTAAQASMQDRGEASDEASDERT